MDIKSNKESNNTKAIALGILGGLLLFANLGGLLVSIVVNVGTWYRIGCTALILIGIILLRYAWKSFKSN